MPIINRTALPYLVKTNTDADIGRRPAVQQYEKQAGSDGATTNTVYTLTNNYVPGTNTLMVFVNGQKSELIAAPSDETEYAETDSSTVTFGASLIDSDVIEFIVVGTYFIQDTELYIAAVNNPMGRKNLIINGSMEVWQRSTSVAAIGNGNSGYHTVDRWQYLEEGAPGGEFTWSQDTDVPSGYGFAYSMQIDCTTAEAAVAADEVHMIGQSIEAQDLQHLNYGTSSAKSITLSFWLKSDTKTGTMCVYIDQPDGTRGYVDEITISDNNWNKHTVVISGDTSGTITNNNGSGLAVWFVLVCGDNKDDATAGAWAAAGEYATTNQDNFLDATANNIFITGVQLEVNTQATDFEFRSFGEELDLCERYYQKSYDYGTSLGTATEVGCVNVRVAAAGSAAVHEMQKPFSTPMRGVPTIYWYSTSSGTIDRVYHASSAVDKTVTSENNPSEKSHGWPVLTAAIATAGHVVRAHYTADAEL